MENLKITYKDAIRESMEDIAKNPNAIFLGSNVKYGTKGDGAFINIPEHQLLETPVAENLMLSMAIGMSIEGYLPIVYYERFDFILNALDAMVNHLDKISYMSDKEFNPKVIIRAVVGGKKKHFFTGPTHTQDFTSAMKKMVNFPIIKLPNNPLKIKDWYKIAFESDRSFLIIEEKDKY